MESSQAEFEELERALGSARFAFDHHGRTSGGSVELGSTERSSLSTILARIPDLDDENAPDAALHSRDIDTASPRKDEAHTIALPPTPPTPERIRASQPYQNPLHAGLAQGSLRSQPSGLSSSAVDWRSLPTPDPSPPRTRENLLLPFYLLDHHSSSFADSFRTADEGQSRADSPTSSHTYSPGGVTTPIVMSEPAEPMDRVAVGPVDSQGPAQRRLWSVIQPGDATKQPDQSLYADRTSPITRGLPVAQPTQNPPSESPVSAEEISTDSKVEPLIDVTLRETSREDVQSVDTDEPEASARTDGARLGTQTRRAPEEDIHDVQDVPRDTTVQRVEEKLRAPHPEPDDPTMVRSKGRSEDIPIQRPRTPRSVTKSSLEDNNVVYKLIREENVKRHSNISDGSVQAVVVALPEHKRTLRHTPKRHSLRGDASLTSNSHRSSAESGRKSVKRNTGTTFTASDTDLTSPDISPSMAKAALKPTPALQLPPDVPVEGHSQPGDRNSPPNASSEANTAVQACRSSGSQSTRRHSLRRSNRDRSIEIAGGSHDDVDVFDGVDDDEEDDTHDNDDTPTVPTIPGLPNDVPRAASPPMHQAAHMSSRPIYIPLAQLNSPPRLRRFSNESRLERNSHVRRTSLDQTSQRASQPLEIKLEQAAKQLTREGHELLDDRHSLALTSTLTSPKRGSFDVHLHHPTHASFSVSQASMPTDIELLEAEGVAFYPHHNESLLVVQQGPRSAGNRAKPDRPGLSDADDVIHGAPLKLTVNASPRTAPGDATGRSKHAVDSPLTNPRPPPDPPTIKFIPPTPSEELDRQLTVIHDAPVTAVGPQRRPSLSQRVRRYSEGLIQPLGFGRFGSLRRQERPPQLAASLPRQLFSTLSPEDRPTHLSSFWHPRGFWEDVDSDEDEYEEDVDLVGSTSDGAAALPPGGDTSHHPRNAQNSIFPRNMSVRMPGFRGTGGFLQGNSLGIDRHGTNNRRPHVRRPQASSEEGQRHRRFNARRQARVWEPAESPLPQESSNQQRQQQSQPRRDHLTPRLRAPPKHGSHGWTLEYVGMRQFRAHLRAARARRADAALERRRELLRSSIGTRVYHDGRYGMS